MESLARREENVDEQIRILVVDDQQDLCQTLSEVLSDEGYETSSAGNGETALEMIRKDFYNVVLLDLKLPDIDGMRLLQEFKKVRPESVVVIITAHATVSNVVDALNRGVDGYITKPLDLSLAKDVIRRGIEKQRLLAERMRQAHNLKEDFMATMEALAALIEVKDPYLAGHSKEVRKWSCMIAGRLGLPEDEIRDIEMAALLHDVGKIGVKGRILDTHGSLTSREFQEVKLHPILGESALKHVKGLANASGIIRHHHENYDGSGYPDGLKDEDIPIGSRIIGVADAFNAMTSDRPYRRALPEEEALSRLVKEKRKQFDPGVVDTFVECMREAVEGRYELCREK
jgi:response regulator RpfG family c-di-GMP phosphodiesterase